MIVVLLGPPGAGKGTQGERVAAALGVPKISTGVVIRDAMKAGTPMDASAIAFTQDYLHTFEKSLTTTKTSAELIQAMKQAYPQVTDGALSLDIGAKVNTGEMKW